MVDRMNERLIIVQQLIILKQRKEIWCWVIIVGIVAIVLCGGAGVYNLYSQKWVSGIIQSIIATLDVIMVGYDIKKIVGIKHEIADMEKLIALLDLDVAMGETFEV